MYPPYALMPAPLQGALPRPRSLALRFVLLPSNSPLSSRRIFRSPVEMSFCVETTLPYHSVTSSALMTSMLSISQHGYGWLPEGS
ncbi:hypothetical protein MLD38_015963 [Melastoma candidum]|uniref:Uncharacterized protein n=1 Tax=Melastoma candidum TaxID=119954 RepID=A0ACB9RJR6_9MYRT|nr:hypothetical protein MLD38_015963 [Melastoma candidum]